MGRQIRKVPVNWQHPINSDGAFKPLCDDYIGALKYYKESVDKFIQAMTTVIKKGQVKIYSDILKTPAKVYEWLTDDNQLSPPNINDYMPSGEWFQLFETVGDGTPLTPPFETKPELVEWLTNNEDFWDHTWTREQAQAMVKTEYAPSAVIYNGKFYDSQESLLIDKTDKK